MIAISPLQRLDFENDSYPDRYKLVWIGPRLEIIRRAEPGAVTITAFTQRRGLEHDSIRD
jgi:hypothetical protein